MKELNMLTEQDVKSWRVVTQGDDHNAMALLAALYRGDVDVIDSRQYGMTGSYLRIDYNDGRIYRSAPISSMAYFGFDFVFEIEDHTQVNVSRRDIAPEWGYPFLMELFTGDIWGLFYSHIAKQ